MKVRERKPVRRLIALAALGLVVLASPSRSGADPASPAPSWSAMATGAERATLLAADGQTRIELYRFDLARFRADVVVGVGAPPHPETAAQLRTRTGAAAVVNGGFFDEHRAPLGLRIASGATRSTLRPNADWGVLLLSDGLARIVHTRELTGLAASGAIQVGPRLVVTGAALGLKPQRARRTAVALDHGGHRLTLVIVDAPIDANELAQRLAAAGFEAALALDGGPSTQLTLAVGKTKVDVAGGYPVPDLLLIAPKAAAAKKQSQ